MEVDEKRIRQAWKQDKIPIILRRNQKGQKLRLRLPYSKHNRIFLSALGSSTPDWNSEKRYWEIPKAWFNNFVNWALNHYGSVYVVQPFKEQEVCAPACWNAVGHECQCQCMGANHGSGNGDGYFVVDEAFATKFGEEKLACRLMKKK